MSLYQTDDLLNYQLKTYFQVTDLKEIYEKFLIIINLLKEIPEVSTLDGDGNPYIDNIESLQKAWKKHRSGLIKDYSLPDKNLHIDEGFRNICNICTNSNLDHEAFRKLAKIHKQFMLLENISGTALEEYIATELENNGWIWCSGGFIQGTDLIKKNTDGTWRFLQIKSRSNTTNSSSSKIGRLIQHRAIKVTIEDWFRFKVSKAKNPKDYTPEQWKKLNDLVGCDSLSEQGFMEFFKKKHSKYSTFAQDILPKIEILFEMKELLNGIPDDLQKIQTTLSQIKTNEIEGFHSEWESTLKKYKFKKAKVANIIDLQEKLRLLQIELHQKIENLDKEISSLGCQLRKLS